MLVLWFCFIKVELIGYAASSDELFLIYEYAQKGSLRSHLHDPQNKGEILYFFSSVSPTFLISYFILKSEFFGKI